jgi:hypothetical protein
VVSTFYDLCYQGHTPTAYGTPCRTGSILTDSFSLLGIKPFVDSLIPTMCFSYTLLPSGGYSKPLLVACGKHVIKELPTGRRFSYTWETTMDFHLLRHSITQLERIVKSEQVETSGEYIKQYYRIRVISRAFSLPMRLLLKRLPSTFLL